MKIKLTSVFVSDQPAASRFCTEILGFVKKTDIPATAFFTDDVQAEYERGSGLGVVFTSPPKTYDAAVLAVFADTRGNLSQLVRG